MSLHILNHAIGSALLSQLRSKETPPERFRHLTAALTQILVVEATRDLPTVQTEVMTPLELTTGARLEHGLVAVPILRAGLGMLDTVLQLLPEASVGYLGLERDEKTAVASSYYAKLPPLKNKTALLLDPMLATGGSAGWCAERLYSAGAERVILLCVVAAPEGVAHLEANFPEMRIFCAALDRELNVQKYIMPGLGDFGDRLFGTF